MEGKNAMDAQLTIGRVARQAGVNVQTLHYYERRGLLSPAGRRESGYRLYRPDAVRRVRFIKNAQELGFTLNEISGLLRLRVSHAARCPDVKKKAQAKLMDIRGKILRLKAMERVLKDLVQCCRSRSTTDHCPILKSLEINGREKKGRKASLKEERKNP